MVAAENPTLDSVLDGLVCLLSSYDYSHLERDLRALKNRATNEGVSFLTKTLPSLGKSLDKGLGSRCFKLPSNFKRRWRGSEIPAFCGSLFSMIFNRDGSLRDDASAFAVKLLRQICFFAYKLVITFSDKDVDHKLQTFIDTDSELPEIFLPGEVAFKARQLTTLVFSDFNRDDIIPSHGPGVTSNISSRGKYVHVPPYSPVVRYFGLKLWMSEEEIRALNFSQLFFAFIKVFACGEDFQPEPYKPHARVVLVPKDSRGPRIISCEPAEHQYVQQGIRKWTQQRLESHWISRGSLNFEDQTINREKARIASMTQGYSTLDLKDASDRVSLALVKYLFGDCTDYLNALLHSRSSHTLIEKTSGALCLELRKFAPMGSAVCFTTLAWTIYVLIFSDLLLRGYKTREIKSNLFVYGDDVIVKTEWVRWAIESLESHDLKVNIDKSFVNSRFCESCGLDAFDGIDVTPVRAREIIKPFDGTNRKRALYELDRSQTHRNKVVKTTSLANSLAAKGYNSAAEYYYQLVEKWTYNALPYGIAESGYLCRVVSTPEDAWINNNRLEFRSRKGLLVRGFVTRPVRGEIYETGASRLRRTMPMLGQDLDLPDFGVASVVKEFSLRRKSLKRWYATAYTNC